MSWVCTTLGEIVQPTRPRHRPQDYPDLPFVGMEHIEAHTMRLTGTVPAGQLRSSAVHFWPSDVLYGRLRPYLNKVYSPEFEGLCSAEFIVFPKSRYVDSGYLKYLLNSFAFVSFASHLNEGDRPRVDFGQIADYSCPLPPLPEQRRIVEAIETQLTRLDAAVAALERAWANLKRYRAAVLKAACEGRLVPTEAELARAEGRAYEPGNGVSRSAQEESPVFPAKWARATLSEISCAIVDCPHSTPNWTEHGRICVRTTEFRPGLLDLTNVRYVSEETYQERIARLKPQEDDILYSREGGILGIACLVPPQVEICMGQRMMLIRTRPQAVPKFVMYLLNSPITLGQVKKITGGSASPHLNVRDVKEFSFLLPPLAEQHRIVVEVERRLSVVEEMERGIAANLKRAERLRQAVLKRAFEGKLVAQNPADEPASVLLKRIRAERAATVSPTRRGRRANKKPKETLSVPLER